MSTEPFMIEGSRSELMEQLDNIATGCLGSARLIEEARQATRALADGMTSVRVGHVVYDVTTA